MRFFLLICISICTTTIFAQKEQALQGAWSSTTDMDGSSVTQILLFSNGYFSWTAFKAGSGEFIQTKGGSFHLDENKLALNYEFNTADTAQVGTTDAWTLATKGDILQLTQASGKRFLGEALEHDAKTDLSGVWLMAGRKQDDKITRRDVTTPRKTMKILTGNRFQWIAYNSATKQFMGTGGGTYTAKDGVYTEHLEFFSRDNKRVGMSLAFKYDRQGNDWHHMGKSSAGEPMYEIWTLRD